MNKTQRIIAGMGFLSLALVIFGTTINNAEAYKGNPNIKGPYYSEERHEAIEKAFETNDYVAWKNLMQNKGRVIQVINEDNFSKFAEAHKLVEKGDLVSAEKIRQELGLGLKNGNGQNINSGDRRGNCTNH
jgi:hypothetical protein